MPKLQEVRVGTLEEWRAESYHCSRQAEATALCSAPKYPVPTVLQHLRHDRFCPLCFAACGEPTNTYHQVVTKPQTKLVRFACGKLSALLVLCETMFGPVSGLANVEGSEGGGFPQAGAIQFDHVNGVSARGGFGFAVGSGLHHSAGLYRLLRHTEDGHRLLPSASTTIVLAVSSMSPRRRRICGNR